MKLPQHFFLIAAGTISGFIVLLLFWTSWNASIEQITAEGLFAAGSFIISAVILLVLALVLLGLNALLVPESKIRFISYALWSAAALVAPSPISLFWKILIATVLWLLFVLCDFSIQRRAVLLVRPVLSLIFPPFFKLWLFGLSILFAISITAHPAIALQEMDVKIPEGIWGQVWEMFGIGLDAEESELRVQSVSSETSIPLSNKAILSEQEMESLTEAFLNSGIGIPDLVGFFQSSVDTESGTVDLSQATDTINTAISETAKSETEEIFRAVLAPLVPFWPYIIGVTFFLSAQVFVPIFVYLGLILLKVLIYFFSIFKIVNLVEENATISRYVLK